HEVGHVLGFGDHAGGNDLMTTALSAGLRRLPEAASSTSSTSSTSSVTTFVSRPTDAVTVQPHAVQQVFVSPAAVDAAFAATGVATPAASAVLDRSGIQASVLLNIAAPVPGVQPIMAASPGAVSARTDRDSTSYSVPGVRPPDPRMESGYQAVLDNDWDD